MISTKQIQHLLLAALFGYLLHRNCGLLIADIRTVINFDL
jgi:hypothetical protein